MWCKDYGHFTNKECTEKLRQCFQKPFSVLDLVCTSILTVCYLGRTGKWVCVCGCVCVKVEYCPDCLPSTSTTWSNMGFATGITCPTLFFCKSQHLLLYSYCWMHGRLESTSVDKSGWSHNKFSPQMWQLRLREKKKRRHKCLFHFNVKDEYTAVKGSTAVLASPHCCPKCKLYYLADRHHFWFC